MIELPVGKLGLCISGGGSKGAYAVGVVQYLYETLKRRDIPLIYGTSTGSLITAMLGLSIATQDPSYVTELIHIYKNVMDGDILKPNHEVAYAIGGELAVLASTIIAGGSSIFDTTPLANLIDRYMTKDKWQKLINAGKRKKNPIEVGFCVVDVQTGRSVLVTNRNHPKASVLRNALLASASQPVFMPAVEIPEVAPDHDFVDGGIIEYTPVEKVFESDIQPQLDGVLSIALDPVTQPPTNVRYQSTTDMLLRTLSIFVDGVYFTDVKISTLWNMLLKMKAILPDPEWTTLVAELPITVQDFINKKLSGKKYVPIYYMEPDAPLDIDSLKFDQKKMRELIKQGFKEAGKKMVNAIHP